MRVAYYGEPLSIFFHANGGTGGKTLAVPCGAALDTYMEKVSPKRDGYAFGGWWTARTGGDQIRSLDTATENATYYAHWIEPSSTYTIFFHANGGTGGKTFTVAGGAKFGTYMDKVSPKRDAYVFDGWWTARAGGIQIGALDVAVGDATYYAHWTALPASCKVFFHANGGTGGKTFTVVGGGKLGAYMDKVSPTRDGYAFDGWWTARTGGSQILSADIAVADATYYAHWLIPECSVFFHANGGTGGKTFTVAGGAQLGTYMDKVSPKREGYTFGGWWTARTGGKQIFATDVAAGDVTYYAHWTAASACVRSVNVPADVSEAVSLANYYGYVYAADGGEAKMLLTLFEGGKATALVGDDVYQGELPILSAPDGATLRVVLEGDAVFGFQQ